MKKAKGQRKTQDPCEGCGLHRSLCICEFIPSLNLRTHLSLIIHAKELKRTTNTGRLATQALIGSDVVVRGKIGEPIDLSQVLRPGYRAVLFYPSSNAVELNETFVRESDLPIQLLVPDGNWRQASKVHVRHPEIAHLPRVMIGTPNIDLHHLRAESTEVGMATLHAIALAYGVIEGHEVGDALMQLYRLKLERTLEGRGVKMK